MNRILQASSIAALLSAGVASAFAQPKQPPTPAQSISRTFAYVNGKILEMAKDWPAEKYSYQPGKGLRTFQEVIIHVTSGVVYAATPPNITAS